MGWGRGSFRSQLRAGAFESGLKRFIGIYSVQGLGFQVYGIIPGSLRTLTDPLVIVECIGSRVSSGGRLDRAGFGFSIQDSRLRA